jgi:hypothetical protein
MLCFRIDLCLTASLEARFELAFARRDDQHANIGLLQPPTTYMRMHKSTNDRTRAQAA